MVGTSGWRVHRPRVLPSPSLCRWHRRRGGSCQHPAIVCQQRREFVQGTRVGHYYATLLAAQISSCYAELCASTISLGLVTSYDARSYPPYAAARITPARANVAAISPYVSNASDIRAVVRVTTPACA